MNRNPFLARLILSALLFSTLAVVGAWYLAMRTWTPAARSLFADYAETHVFSDLGGPPSVILVHREDQAWRVQAADFFARVDRAGWGPVLRSRFWWVFEFSPLLGAGLGLWFSVFLASRRKRKDPSHAEVQRGAEVITPRQLSRLSRRRGPGDLYIGGVPIPRHTECLHFLFAGTTGSGKTVAITRLLDVIRERGDRAIVADASGIFLSRYWHAGDELINPLDAGCAPWSPLAEMEDERDAEVLAKSYIPDLAGEGRQWSGYAQTVLGEILRYAWLHSADNASLHRLACVTDRQELTEVLPGTPAAAIIDPGNGTMGANVRSMVASAMAPISDLPPTIGRGGFSVSRYVAEGQGWLYLPYRHRDLDSQRSLIGGLLDTAARALLSLSPHQTRRIWIVADELPVLGTVSSLELIATNARKFGGVLVLGLQNIAQLRDRYGNDRATSILSCLNTWLILRTSDSETARLMADQVGQREVRRQVQGGQQAPGAAGPSSSWAEQVAIEHAVLPAELQALPSLHGYLSLPGLPSARVKLTLPPDRPQAAPAFLPRQRQKTPQPAKAASASAPDLPSRAKPADDDMPTIEVHL